MNGGRVNAASVYFLDCCVALFSDSIVSLFIDFYVTRLRCQHR
jgi:hypothetical protein